MDGWEEFGAELQAGRKAAHLSLRQAAKRTWCSRSTVHRLEQGHAVGRQSVVSQLDEVYGAGGTLTDKYGLLMHGRWYSRKEPAVLDDRDARGSWQHVYPADHSGDVWIGVRPTRSGAANSYQIVLHWGPWQQIIEVESLAEQGLVLVTGKSRDVVPVPVRVEVSPPGHVLFGTDDEHTVDLTGARRIHRNWRDVERDVNLQGLRGGASATLRALLSAIDDAAEDPAISAKQRENYARAAATLVEIGPDHLIRLLGRRPN